MIVLACVAALAASVERAAAQGQSWCLIDESKRKCGFHTFEQCLASRAGGSSHCEQNVNSPGNRSDANRPARSDQRR